MRKKPPRVFDPVNMNLPIIKPFQSEPARQQARRQVNRQDGRRHQDRRDPFPPPGFRRGGGDHSNAARTSRAWRDGLTLGKIAWIRPSGPMM